MHDRSGSSIFREKGKVNIQRHTANGPQKPGRQYLAVGGNDDEIGPEILNDFSIVLLSNFLRLKNRNSLLLGVNLNRGGLHPVSATGRTIRLCKNGLNVMRMIKEKL